MIFFDNKSILQATGYYPLGKGRVISLLTDPGVKTSKQYTPQHTLHLTSHHTAQSSRTLTDAVTDQFPNDTCHC